MKKLKEHPFMITISLCIIIGFVISCFIAIFSIITKGYNEYTLFEMVTYTFLIGVFIAFPFALTVLNIAYLIIYDQYLSRFIDAVTFVFGMLCQILISIVLSINDIQFFSNWNVELYNQQVHTPIWTKAYLTVVCLWIIGIIGYLVLTYISLKKLPPLITVLCISAMYIGIFENILWIIQIMGGGIGYSILCLLPFNCIVIGIKTLRYKILEWKDIELSEKRGFKNQFLNRCNKRLMNASSWPFVSFIFMWPLLGIIMCILLLFNQQPDYFIQSYLNTSDWSLSQKVSPQNVYYDQHYLCTVAAGGHKKVVKPLRLGMRHHHQVIVNRQLCIANAFEQIIEEKIPRVHHVIRHIYDQYGFPIAKMIHSPLIADCIYFIMKPLEWLFLVVIYCCDVHPENRIAIQYTTYDRDIKQQDNLNNFVGEKL